MVKYIQNAIDKLKALKSGMEKNAAKWTGQPIDTTDIDDAITILNAHATDLETAQIQLGKLQQLIHGVVDDQELVAEQAENLARGIHTMETEKLLDYGIKQPKEGTLTRRSLQLRRIYFKVCNFYCSHKKPTAQECYATYDALLISPQSLFAWFVCSKDSAACFAPKLKYKIAA